jgi:hypothetical protein
MRMGNDGIWRGPLIALMPRQLVGHSDCWYLYHGSGIRSSTRKNGQRAGWQRTTSPQCIANAGNGRNCCVNVCSNLAAWLSVLGAYACNSNKSSSDYGWAHENAQLSSR